MCSRCGLSTSPLPPTISFQEALSAGAGLSHGPHLPSPRVFTCKMGTMITVLTFHGWEEGGGAWSWEVVGLSPVMGGGVPGRWLGAWSPSPNSPSPSSAFSHLPCFLPQACSAVDLPALGRNNE